MALFNFFRRKPKTSVLPIAAPAKDLGKPEAAKPVQQGSAAMSGGDLHVPREKVSKLTLQLHYAIDSLREELEAVDWYRQRADDCDDPELKAILLHNMREEIEHAAMVLEWIRRNEPTFGKELKEYLFQEGPIVGRESEVMGRK